MVEVEELSTEMADEIVVVPMPPSSGAGCQKERSSHFVASAVVR